MIRKDSGSWDTGNPGTDTAGSAGPASRAVRPRGERTRAGAGLPVVAIVGRPNVGKSTLFNRLVGLRKAIVEDTPGVTRDTNLGEAEWGSARFLVMDTGGLESAAPPDRVLEKVRVQIEKAVDQADVLLFLVDGKVNVHPEDLEIARMLRKKQKPILCAVNKIDTEAHTENIYPFYRFGLEPLFPVSAEHGIGLGELLDALVERLPPPGKGLREEPKEEPIRVAVVGRPNVGKSTLVNRLLGEERLVVDERPGTTRDAIDTPFTWRGRAYLLIDTAGIRKKAKVTVPLEKISVIKALQSLERCDVALLMVDAQEGIGDQDAQIGRMILEKGKSVVILANKWDLLKGRDRTSRQVLAEVRDQMPHLKFAPVVPISALTGYNLVNAMRWIQRVERSGRMRVPTGPLNRLLEAAVKAHPPPSEGPRVRKLNYIAQIKTGPPTFLVFSNTTGKMDSSYERYLINQIRNRFGFKGVPLRVVFRKKK